MYGLACTLGVFTTTRDARDSACSKPLRRAVHVRAMPVGLGSPRKRRAARSPSLDALVDQLGEPESADRRARVSAAKRTASIKSFFAAATPNKAPPTVSSADDAASVADSVDQCGLSEFLRRPASSTDVASCSDGEPGQQRGSPSANACPTGDGDSVRELMKSVVDGRSAEYLEEIVGAPLTAENLEKFQAKFASVQPAGNEQPEKARAGLLKGKDAQAFSSLKKILDDGVFDSRGAMGNKFRRDLQKDESLGERYAGLSRAESKEFRQSWAKKELAKLEEKHVVTTAWSKVDKQRFQYRTLGRLVKDFGGWEDRSAILGACQAASKCLALGPPWTLRHPQSGMVQFAIVELEWEETFSRSWEQLQVACGVGENASDAASSAVPDAQDPRTRAGHAPGLKGPKASRGAGEDTRTGTSLAIALKAATKLRAEFINASHAAVELEKKIVEDPSWSWAKTDKLATLRTLQAAARGSVTEFGQEIVLTDLKDLQKITPKAKLEVELTKFLDSQSAVFALGRFVGALRKAQKALAP